MDEQNETIKVKKQRLHVKHRVMIQSKGNTFTAVVGFNSPLVTLSPVEKSLALCLLYQPAVD
jgi:hypothetical protein